MRNFQLLLASASLALSGCGDSPVATVKDGTIGKFSGTTVGRAFGASFSDATWSSRQTPKGEVVVSFTGKVTRVTHDAMAKSILDQLNTEPFSRATVAIELLSQGLCRGALTDQKIQIAAVNSVAPFSGDAKYIASCVEREVMPIGSAVRVDFSINARGNTFEIKRFEVDSTLLPTLDGFLAVVYQ